MKRKSSSPDPGSAVPNGADAKRVLTTFEAAKELGVAFSTVNYWVDSGMLRGFRTPGGHRRIPRASLDAFIAEYHYGRIDVPARVLIVDDDAAFRRSMKRRLTAAKIGAELLEADNGFDAGRIIAEEKPGVVILDIHLPGIDGFEVMRQVVGMKHRPKIIAVSGHAPVEYRARSLKLGAAAFFSKPVDTDAFLEVLRGLLKPGRDAVPHER